SLSSDKHFLIYMPIPSTEKEIKKVQTVSITSPTVEVPTNQQ
ncbi:12441_t:CDS:1, partial [Funneliformis caledonium]